MAAGSDDYARFPNRQRVAPDGSAVATPNAVAGLTTYRSHGGGPALGALNAAVRAAPRTLAGQPWAAYRWARRRSVDRSVTRIAVPSITRSMPVSETATAQARFAARFRLFLVRGPLVKKSFPSTQSAPTAATCGRP